MTNAATDAAASSGAGTGIGYTTALAGDSGYRSSFTTMMIILTNHAK